MSKTGKRYIAPVVCIALVAAFLVARQMRPGPRFGAEGDTDRYHWQVRQALEKIESSTGRWTATKVKVKPAAQDVRNPNIVYSRRFTNQEKTIQAEVLLVQSKDIRDMAGYKPDRYYPANGYVTEHEEPKYWTVGGLDIFGRRYEFRCPTASGGSERRIVDQFVILPNGQITGELDNVAKSADNEGNEARGGRTLGAAQIHVVTDGGLTDEQRDATFTDLIQTFAGVIETIRSGADG